MAEDWQSIAARKQDERQSRIPQDWLLKDIPNSPNVLNIPRSCGILSVAELIITERFDACELLEEIKSGRLSSTDATTAFCKRAAIAQQLTNCLTEIFFDQAVERATYLDTYLKKNGRTVGPLHGLPISLKDSFKVKGYDCSLGVAALCFQPANSNSALVDLLLSLGAVLYCKTNVPQTLTALDSHNNIFGRTLNPANLDLTAGGSSGGEGALVALKGSPLGVGTDVGGSIRVPAMCNGLYGVKPSHGRVPFAGQQGGSRDGNNKITMEATAGPIARSVRDCAMFLRVISDSEPWRHDPDVIPQDWEQQSRIEAHPQRSLGRATSVLRVGVVSSDGHTLPLPPVQRVISEVAASLRSHQSIGTTSIEVIDLDITSLMGQCVKTFNGILSIDGGNSWFDLLESKNEPLSPWLQGRLRRRPQKVVNDVTQLQAQKTVLQTKFLSIWRESGGYWQQSSNAIHNGTEKQLDIIICPVAPHPVALIDRWNGVNYTGAFNLLDYPAGVLPVRPVTDDDLKLDIGSSKSLNGWDKVNQDMWTNVDRRLYLNSPLSIQVVAPKLMERKLVESMALVDRALRESSALAVASRSRL